MEMGALGGRRVAVLGAAYRFDSEDTRNSPSLVLANLLRDSGADVILHDPHVPARDVNLARYDLTSVFTHDLDQALDNARSSSSPRRTSRTSTSRHACVTRQASRA